MTFLFHLILPILNVKQNVSVDKFESGAEVELQEKIERSLCELRIAISLILKCHKISSKPSSGVQID